MARHNASFVLSVPAAPSIRNGRGDATRAANGTPSSKKKPKLRRPGRSPPRAAAKEKRSNSPRLKAAAISNRVILPETQSLTGLAAAALSLRPRSSLAAIRASASRRFSSRWPRGLAANGRNPSHTSPAKRPWRRYGCALRETRPFRRARGARFAATSLRDILATLKSERPDVVIVDSIQTLWSDALPAAPGTVTQVRACAQELIRFAKSSGSVMILVGHVTKDGQIAGPRVVEHMVDAVMYFESEQGRTFRLLRAVKNRFGAAHEIGVFEMTGAGLREVSNPSELFLAEGGDAVPGAAVFAGVEGTRPVLVEIQALVSPSSLAAPRRAVVGWDASRLSMLLAVLDARCGLDFGRNDVFSTSQAGCESTNRPRTSPPPAALCSSLFDCACRATRPSSARWRYPGPFARSTSRMRASTKRKNLGFQAFSPPPSPAKRTLLMSAQKPWRT